MPLTTEQREALERIQRMCELALAGMRAAEGAGLAGDVMTLRALLATDNAEPEPPTVAPLLTKHERQVLRRVLNDERFVTESCEDASPNGPSARQGRETIKTIDALLARAAKSDELCVVRREDARHARRLARTDAEGVAVIVNMERSRGVADRISAALTDGTPQRGEGAG